MCQPVSGPRVVLEERQAWKVFRTPNLHPLYYSRTGKILGGVRLYERGRWYKSTGVKAFYDNDKMFTEGGFHVFTFKKDAVEYALLDDHVEKVLVRGKALPFDGAYGPGWAVHEMMIPEKP